MAWEVSINMQPLFDNYKAVAYMCPYLSKLQNKCSFAKKQTVKDVLKNS